MHGAGTRGNNIEDVSKNQWKHRIENHNETVQSVYNRFTTEQLMEKAVMKQVFDGFGKEDSGGTV